MNNTTKKHFKLFKQEGKKWQKRLGLMEWEIMFTHLEEEEEETVGSRGTCFAVADLGSAIINLNTKWPEFDIVTHYQIRKTAFHEMCELLMWPLRVLLLVYFSDGVVRYKIHSILRRMENAFYEEE